MLHDSPETRIGDTISTRIARTLKAAMIVLYDARERSVVPTTNRAAIDGSASSLSLRFVVGRHFTPFNGRESLMEGAFLLSESSWILFL